MRWPPVPSGGPVRRPIPETVGGLRARWSPLVGVVAVPSSRAAGPVWVDRLGGERRFVGIFAALVALPRLHAAAAHDETLSTAFARVLGLIDRPENLLRPDRLLRVWQTNRRHPAPPAVTTAPHPQMK